MQLIWIIKKKKIHVIKTEKQNKKRGGRTV